MDSDSLMIIYWICTVRFYLSITIIVHKLQTAQGSMEKAMREISRKHRVRNAEIRRKTKISGIMERIAGQKWRSAGPVARQATDRWS